MKVRKYEDLSKYEPPTHPDEDDGGDWIKYGTWDLPIDPEEFRDYLEHSGMTLEKFLGLPVAKSMPVSLRRALGVRMTPFLEKKEEKE